MTIQSSTDLPEYDAAVQTFLGKVILGFRKLDPLLGQFQSYDSTHAGPIRNVRGASPLDQVFDPLSGTALMSHESLRTLDISHFTSFAYELAQDLNKALHRQLLGTLVEVTEATGNVTDAGGNDLSWDFFIDTWSRMPIEFDDAGNPQLPMLILHPTLFAKLQALPFTDEQIKRHRDLIEQKRKEFYAQKRTRRISI